MLGAVLTISATTTAASPAGEYLGTITDFRDDPGTAVLCVYPEGEGPLGLTSFRVRGPRVQWLRDHPDLERGTVAWTVTIRSAPTKRGPWTVEKVTRESTVLAEIDEWVTFSDRTVDWKDRPGTAFARVRSRITWVNEDGGSIGWISHRYTSFGLVASDGSVPDFGQAQATRQWRCANRWVGP
jgi:hypothetical protein